MGKGSNYGLSEIQHHAGLTGHIDNSVTVCSLWRKLKNVYPLYVPLS